MAGYLVTITIRLPIELIEALEACAYGSGQPKVEVLREALKEYLQQRGYLK